MSLESHLQVDFFSHIFLNYIFCYLNVGNIKREITASNAAKYCDI